MNFIGILLILLLGLLLVVIFITSNNPKNKVSNTNSNKLTSPNTVDNNTITKVSYSLGTTIYLKSLGVNSKEAIDECIIKLNDLDNKLSAFKEYSDVSSINNAAGEAFVAVSKDTYNVIKKSIYYSNMLKGTFDITIRPLVELWRSKLKSNMIPNKNEIQKTLELINYKDICFDDDNLAIKLKNKNQKIDLGGIAKGFAADELVKIFNKNNISSALIDLGGNIYVHGMKNDNENWKVGIQNPFEKRGSHIGILNVSNKSIVTSGNYENFYEVNNQKYHHILDISTGMPSDSEIISATIISDKSIDGDGLSTGIYILGTEKSLELINSLDGVDAILVTNDKKVYVTNNIKPYFKLTNEKFIYKN